MDVARIIANKFIETHPVDAARVLEKLPAEAAAALLEATPPPLASSVVFLMDVYAATTCLAQMSADKAGALVGQLLPEVSVLLLRRIGEPQSHLILDETPEGVRGALRTLLRYPEGTAGALMDAHVFWLLEDSTVKEALHEIREHAHHLSTYLYVVGREGHLVGVLSFREVFLAPHTAHMASIMHTPVQKLDAYTDQAAMLAHPGWLAHHALPVVEKDDLLVGVVGYQTLRRLEQIRKGSRQAQQVNMAGTALGELYLIGLSGLFRSAAPLTGAPDHEDDPPA